MIGSMKPESFCPEENPFTVFWNSEEEEFQKEENEPDINIACNSRTHIDIAENKLVFNNDEWLLSMDNDQVDELIRKSSTQDICVRRHWSNEINHQKLYPNGNCRGFSGIPYRASSNFFIGRLVNPSGSTTRSTTTEEI